MEIFNIQNIQFVHMSVLIHLSAFQIGGIIGTLKMFISGKEPYVK
jgi:hypothetical protein